MVERQFCTGCGACAAVCPQKVIHMAEDAEGFAYPVVEAASCTQCGLCTQACPAAERRTYPGERACFGAKAKEERVRRMASSGGVFPLLAAQVLADGGSVWGAAMAEGGAVRHIGIQTEADIPKITRTKYVQSNLDGVWEKLREQAQAGKPVLFCGTPCQADAVRSFLGEGRGTLILVDLICYGVPSPGIWRRYASHLEGRYGGTLESFSFRDKRNGDNGHTCAARIGGTEYTWPLDSDPYCKSMFRNINLRPSCFQCRYCTTDRGSDITIGDFWGIGQARPGFDDGMGCSAVICHTDAGKRLWERIKGETQWFACPEADIANEAQPRLREPTRAHPKRGLYMGLARLMPFPLWLRLLRR